MNENMLTGRNFEAYDACIEIRKRSGREVLRPTSFQRAGRGEIPYEAL